MNDTHNRPTNPAEVTFEYNAHKEIAGRCPCCGTPKIRYTQSQVFKFKWVVEKQTMFRKNRIANTGEFVSDTR